MKPARAGGGGKPRILPPRLGHVLPILAVLTAGWVAGWAAVVHGDHWPLPIDRTVDRPLVHLSLRWHHLASGVAHLSDPWRFALVGLVFLVAVGLFGSVRWVVAGAASVAAETAVIEILKPIVDRHLPFAGSSYSYPSGHTGVATAIATMAVLLSLPSAPKGRYLHWWGRAAIAVLAVVGVAAVGASMIVLDEHYFTDIIAAVPLSATVTLACCAGIDWAAEAVGAARSSDAAPYANSAPVTWEGPLTAPRCLDDHESDRRRSRRR